MFFKDCFLLYVLFYDSFSFAEFNHHYNISHRIQLDSGKNMALGHNVLMITISNNENCEYFNPVLF